MEPRVPMVERYFYDCPACALTREPVDLFLDLLSEGSTQWTECRGCAAIVAYRVETVPDPAWAAWAPPPPDRM